jgi:Putative glycosyltransferase (DUF6716)
VSNRAVRSESAAATTATVRVLAIADTDPYLKSSTTTLDALPDLWQSRQLLIQNPVMPSKAQIQVVTRPRHSSARAVASGSYQSAAISHTTTWTADSASTVGKVFTPWTGLMITTVGRPGGQAGVAI